MTPVNLPLSLYSPRIRFNWGFHDATADREAKRRNRQHVPQGTLFCLPKADKAYCAGYVSGQSADLSNGRPESSEPAWLEYKGEQAKEREKRAFLRDARPPLFEQHY